MDGEFCRAVREIVGPDVPVGITLDMHANVSQQVVAESTVQALREQYHLNDPWWQQYWYYISGVFQGDLGLDSGVPQSIYRLEPQKLGMERVALKSLRPGIKPTASVWISWPKKSAKVATDITEDTIREVALPLAFVDIKVCAVTEVWSGLKLVIRKELRKG